MRNATDTSLSDTAASTHDVTHTSAYREDREVGEIRAEEIQNRNKGFISIRAKVKGIMRAQQVRAFTKSMRAQV